MITEKDISCGVTAFIDILGFGDKVLNVKSLCDIKKIRKRILLIQKSFEFETNDKLVLEVQKLYGTSVLAFSDCVVVNIPLQSEAIKYTGTFDTVMLAIIRFALGQGNCCLKSLFIRGGIDLGWWYKNDSILISKSMVNAYKTESSASVPVIALSNELYDFLSNHNERNHYAENYDQFSKVFLKYKDCEKEFYFINYIPICLESLDNLNFDDWLCRHARKIEDAHNAAVDLGAKQKYVWLSKYHNNIVPNYTKNVKCRCAVPTYCKSVELY